MWINESGRVHYLFTLCYEKDQQCATVTVLVIHQNVSRYSS